MRRVSLALAAAVALAFPVHACRPLDQRSLHPLPAYGQATRLARARGAQAVRGEGPLSAGWSRAEIHMPEGSPLAGYGARRGAPHEGTLDPVAVRAFAFEREGARALLFTADVLFVPQEIADAVRDALSGSIPRDAIFLTASHTHSGPGGFARGFLFELVFGPYDPRAREAVVGAFIRAAEGALRDLAPAAVGVAEVTVSGLMKNRVELDGPTDDVLIALHLRHLEEDRSALFWSFGCHPVTLGPENRKLSADYPGTVARRLEGEQYEVVGFAAGGVGSAVPAVETGTAELAAPLERALLRAAHEAGRRARARGRSAWASARVGLPVPDYRAFGVWPVPWPLVRALIGAETGDFGALALDDALLVFLPVELSGTLTRGIRGSLRARGVRSALLPFSGTYAGYVVPERVFELPPERRGAMHAYETETLGFFGPGAADFFVNVSLRLALGVLRAVRAAP